MRFLLSLTVFAYLKT